MTHFPVQCLPSILYTIGQQSNIPERNREQKTWISATHHLFDDVESLWVHSEVGQAVKDLHQQDFQLVVVALDLQLQPKENQPTIKPPSSADTGKVHFRINTGCWQQKMTTLVKIQAVFYSQNVNTDCRLVGVGGGGGNGGCTWEIILHLVVAIHQPVGICTLHQPTYTLDSVQSSSIKLCPGCLLNISLTNKTWDPFLPRIIFTETSHWPAPPVLS